MEEKDLCVFGLGILGAFFGIYANEEKMQEMKAWFGKWVYERGGAEKVWEKYYDSKTKDTHELAEFYNAADVFVNLTYCDVFGMVNIEALACNTPVITYNTGGSPETVRDYGGIIIDKGNLLGVIKSMEDAITKRTIMGKGDVIEKRYGKKQIMNQYIMLYK